jgi:hypothetical protein
MSAFFTFSYAFVKMEATHVLMTLVMAAMASTTVKSNPSNTEGVIAHCT